MLETNVTADGIVDGETVTLTCSLKYRTSSNGRENIRITIDHPGAEEIDKVTKRDVIDETHQISIVVIVKVNGSKNAEEPTFGPLRCKVDFSQSTNDTELAHNAVQITSDNMSAVIVLRKCFVRNLLLSLVH